MQKSTDAAPSPEALALLGWYDRARRDLPWRVAPDKKADPYRVWLSEIMLQQTTVAAVKPYFSAFLARWPTVTALAGAPREDILAAWAGLGYYSRARNLHACAREVVAAHGGRFPSSEAALRALPGVGAYTAAAIAAIAFGQRAVVVDGNVERVMARYFAVEEPLPAAKPLLRRHADALTPARRAGDYAQGVMDLGATVCTPRKPHCGICPLSGTCAAKLQGIAEDLPRKVAKAARPVRRGAAFILLDGDQRIMIRTRPSEGLLGGMSEPPMTDWVVDAALPDHPAGAPVQADWRNAGAISHVFTHFRLELAVFAAISTSGIGLPEGMRWLAVREIDRAALPTVMKKAITRGLAELVET